MNQVQSKIAQQPHPKLKRTVFKISISIIILLLLLFYLPIPVIISSIKQISISEWSICLFIAFFIHILGVCKWRWQQMAARIKLRFLTVLRFYAAGVFANIFMPSIIGGDVLRTGLVIYHTGEKRNVILSSLIDRLCDVISLCILAVFGSLFVSNFLELNLYMVLIIVISVVIGLLIFGLGLLCYKPPKWWPRRFRHQTMRLKTALWCIVNNYRLTLSALFLSITLQVCLILLNATIGKAVGLNVPTILWFFVFPMAKMAAMIPISFGGIGVQELTMVGLMNGLGETPALALSQSLLWRGIIIAHGALYGLVWFVLNKFIKTAERTSNI